MISKKTTLSILCMAGLLAVCIAIGHAIRNNASQPNAEHSDPTERISASTNAPTNSTTEDSSAVPAESEQSTNPTFPNETQSPATVPSEAKAPTVPSVPKETQSPATVPSETTAPTVPFVPKETQSPATIPPETIAPTAPIPKETQSPATIPPETIAPTAPIPKQTQPPATIPPEAKTPTVPNETKVPDNTAPIHVSDNYVTQQYNDIHIIPDKHNTGLSNPAACTITLEHGTEYPQYGGVHFRQDNTRSMYIDFGHPNHRKLEGEILFENVDFRKTHSDWTGAGNCHFYSGSGITIRYKNCRFARWYVRDFDVNIPIKFEFENCSFESVVGCNITMDHCYIGGGDRDAMNPSMNVRCYNTYIADISHKTKEQGKTHLDGMQTLCCQDLYFHNCRWEVPAIKHSVSAGGFSYTIYLEPIRGFTGQNTILDHCFINGGGYYAISCTAKADPEDNIRIIEPFIGACYWSTPFYPANFGNQAKKITENPRFHDSLYVSSVWKGNDGILHFLATNDTYEDRTLTVYTNHGKQEFFLKKTYKQDDYETDTLEFSDFPIDLEFSLKDPNPDYVVFYDGDRQIRFVNYTDSPVLKPNLTDTAE